LGNHLYREPYWFVRLESLAPAPRQWDARKPWPPRSGPLRGEVCSRTVSFLALLSPILTACCDRSSGPVWYPCSRLWSES